MSKTNLTRRVGLSFAGGTVLLLTYAAVYQWGMATFEGEQLSYIRALQVVLEALTTAGFGGDAPWSSTAMNAMIITMNLTGVLLVFFAIPFFVVPLLEDAFQTEIPTETTLSEHVVVCADSPRESALRAELDKMDVPALFVKRDETLVRELLQAEIEAMQGDPRKSGTLERANVPEAKAMIVDVDDEANASIILAARRLAPDLRIVSVVEDSESEEYHRYAGADEVVRPRVAVGERLATNAEGTELLEQFQQLQLESDPPELTEVLVERGSELAGQTIAECAFRQRYGVTVLGGWFHGEFIAPVEPDRRLVEHTVLLVVGHTDELTTLERKITTEKHCEQAVVAGYGVVGETVTESLTASGIDVTVIDETDKPGVDVVGDITDPETLRRATVEEADSVVLALSRDSLAVYSALVINDHAPEVEILARADDVEYVQQCYDGGASFTLALSEVTAHMVTAQLFESDSDDVPADRCEIARMRAPGLVGQQLGTAAIHTKTGVQILAVVRNGTLNLNPGPAFEPQQSDRLVLAGSTSAIAEFERRYANR